MTARRVVVLGAAGRLGSVLRAGLADEYSLICAGRDSTAARPGEQWVTVDVTDLVQVEATLAGAEAVVHLAGISQEGAPADIQRVNIGGTVNVLEAARRAGVRRVVLAGSNHAVGGYEAHADELPPTRMVSEDDPVWPDSFYGAAKAHDEAVGRWYAERDERGPSVVCLRIGTCGFDADENAMRNARMRSTWLSERDFVSFVRASIEASVRFGIYFAVSDNDRRFWSLERGQAELGIRPLDRAEDLRPAGEWDRYDYRLPDWVS
ncbi:NAD-dependent epimerase/dehydratase family protein [Microbacterium sp. CPCC 204701]|uniref:NAD-dependent epimerase/dehydratase family protein n=1 Tax=Microbacterium sp. CPCC 204701 TaxID=2493084 RepID=UPI0013E33762|nr:NAD(P)-dependent oxidoreductase [Microbacterium sp. CPCC 204701]